MKHWLYREGDTPEPLERFPTALQFGLSVYTSFLTPLDPLWMNSHFDRLERDARALEIPWFYPPDALAAAVQAVVSPQKPVVRLTVYPDVSAFGDFFSLPASGSSLLLSVREAPTAPATGISLKTVQYQRPMARIKHGSMMETIHLKRLARAGGYEDVLFVNSAGGLSEASTANLFLVRDGCLCTPHPDEDACLPGIARQRILHWANLNGLPVSIGRLPATALREASGMFLCNSVTGLQPVLRVDELAIRWDDASRDLVERVREALG